MAKGGTPLKAMSEFRFFIAAAVFWAGAANASPKHVQVKVLSATSYQFQSPPFFPPNCNWRDISAYCTNSSPVTYVRNTMIVQEPNGRSLEIGCTVEDEWSHCAALRVDQTLQAKKTKNGLEIRYLDLFGKWRKAVYEILPEAGN
jgi:hypothetical protein